MENIKPAYSLYNYPFTIFLLVIFLALGSCRSTKFIPEEKYLLNKVKIEINNPDLNKEELYTYIQQKPNRRTLFLFKFHLAVYNMANSGSERKWKNWIKDVIGEGPVIYDPYLERKSKKQLDIFLENKGYYLSEIEDTIKIRRKKVNLEYNIKTKEPYTINKVYYEIQDSLLEEIIISDRKNSLIKQNVALELELFQNERIRITNLLQNLGFYRFSKEFIYYEIDTINRNLKADIIIGVKQFIRKIDQDNYTQESHRKFYINQIYIYTDFDPKYSFDPKLLVSVDFDTLEYSGFTFIYKNNLQFKPEVLLQSVYIKKNEIYKKQNIDLTYEYLSALRVFRLININFTEELTTTNITTNSSSINAYIYLTPLKEQSFVIEVEGTNSSASFGGDNIGFASNFIYRHKNLFNGAELLDFSITGAFGVQTIKTEEVRTTYQTYEYGFKANLYIPKFLLPLRIGRFIKKYNPKTIIPIAYNFQNRPAYIRNIANFGFGYYWKGSKYLNFIVKPLNLNFVKYSDINTSLLNEDIISLYNGYQDQFIPFGNYSLIYTNQTTKSKKYNYLISNVEIAGNLFKGFGDWFDFNTSDEGNYTLFGSEFAQYFKYDIDLRHYINFSEHHNIVLRSFIGNGFPYGNSQIIPPLKQFYSGGAYSIRAWQARSLGPGKINYKDQGAKYPNQLGDIKFEANVEYRFDLFWILEGALFIDAGNIWYLNKEKYPEDGRFKFSEFYKDIAIGIGFGTRLDFSFFVFRIDFGVPARDPSLVNDNKWIIGSSQFNLYDDMVFNLAIGYPF